MRLGEQKHPDNFTPGTTELPSTPQEWRTATATSRPPLSAFSPNLCTPWAEWECSDVDRSHDVCAIEVAMFIRNDGTNVAVKLELSTEYRSRRDTPSTL